MGFAVQGQTDRGEYGENPLLAKLYRVANTTEAQLEKELSDAGVREIRE